MHETSSIPGGFSAARDRIDDWITSRGRSQFDHFCTFAEELPAAVCVTRPDGTTLWGNRSFRSLNGRIGAGANWLPAFPKNVQSAIHAASGIVSSGPSRAEFEFPFAGNNGTAIACNLLMRGIDFGVDAGTAIIFAYGNDSEVAQTDDDAGDAIINRLTKTETAILVCIGRGMSSKEISRELGLTLKSVDSHKYRLMKKLNFHDRVHVALFAVRNRLVVP